MLRNTASAREIAMLSLSVADERLSLAWPRASASCRRAQFAAPERGEDYHRLLEEIRRVEGEPVSNPPWQFKAVVAFGALVLALGAGSAALALMRLLVPGL